MKRITRREKIALAENMKESTPSSTPKKPRVRGTCSICRKRTSNALVVRGKTYIDADGTKKKADDALYHRECYKMQNKGLLNAGRDSTPQVSIGKHCGGCNSVIEDGDKYAHRNGIPYHRECLT